MSKWSHRKKITIDSAKVDAELTDFPVVIHLDSDSDLADKARSSGDDIKFEDTNGTQLSHEIESYDGSTGTLWAHVKIPSLSSTSDTTIYIYYGNTDAANQESVADVWANGFEGVWHLDESASGVGNADVYQDSTSNNNPANDNASASGRLGQMYQGQELDGVDDYLNTDSSSTFDISGKDTLTFGIWVYVRNFPASDFMTPFTFAESVDDNVRDKGFNIFSGGDVRAKIFDGNSENARANDVISTETWHNLQATYDGSTLKFYVDGLKVASESATGSFDFESPLVQWSHSARTRIKRFDGYVDETRVVSVARSAEWISTSYTNQNDPLSFYSVGAEEALKPSKRAVATASSTAAASSTQIDTRDAFISAVGEASTSATVRRPADASADAAATTDLSVILPTPITDATTPTGLTTEVVTTATEQARASVTTAKSTAVETKSRIFKFADATAAATASVVVSVPVPSSPAAVLLTASPRAALTPRETTPNRRDLDGSSDTEAAYSLASDRVEYDEPTDEIDYDTR